MRSICSQSPSCRSHDGPMFSLQTRPLAAVVPSIRSQRSKTRNAACNATSQQIPYGAVLIDIDAVVEGLTAIRTAWAYKAVEAMSAGAVAGTPGVYTRYMQQLLPVINEPYEATWMLRLLHEEGIVGARSTAGREGPVVGRAVRHTGSRPLLLMEIIEHWTEEILPTCLLRWSRQAGCSCRELEATARSAYEQAQGELPWEVLDVHNHVHGMSQARQALLSTAGCQNPASAATASAACLTKDSGSQAANSSSDQTVLQMIVQPYVSLVPCLQRCPVPVHVASHYPEHLTRAVLSAVQLPVSEVCINPGVDLAAARQGVQVVHGSTMQQCLQQLQNRGRVVVGLGRDESKVMQAVSARAEALNSRQQNMYSSSSSPSSHHNSSRNSSSSRDAINASAWQQQQQTLVVLSSPVHAPEQVLQHLRSANDQQQEHTLTAQRQRQADEVRSQPGLAALQVAEWSCTIPSLRAKALSTQGLELLSEWGFAEMLGADSCDAVMDGIAWKS